MGQLTEPVPLVGSLEGRQFQIFDLGRWTAITTIDLSPGDKSEPLDVAVRFDDDVECFPWNNENYFSNPTWRNPNRVLQRGQYLVRVNVRGSGQKCQAIISLSNAGTRSDFRLERANEAEIKEVQSVET